MGKFITSFSIPMQHKICRVTPTNNTHRVLLAGDRIGKIGRSIAKCFVLGNAHELTASLLMPGNSIAATIANEFTEADSAMYRSSLVALGFVLFLVTFVVLALARLMLRRLARREGL